MKPSNFTSYPWDSVLQKTESETVACNIMKILKRTGDEWRELPYEEYEAERKKDRGYTYSEKQHFEKVIPYCKSPETAALFSKQWRNDPEPQ